MKYELHEIKAMLAIVSGAGGMSFHAYTEDECPFPPEQLSGVRGYTVIARHLFWLYGIDGERGMCLNAFLDLGADMRWLFSSNAVTLYKAKVIQRQNEQSADNNQPRA